MTRQEYKSLRNMTVVGRFVRLTRDVMNGGHTIQAGATLEITRKFSGFDANSMPCTTCGVGVRISRLDPESVELIPRGQRIQWGREVRST